MNLDRPSDGVDPAPVHLDIFNVSRHGSTVTLDFLLVEGVVSEHGDTIPPGHPFALDFRLPHDLPDQALTELLQSWADADDVVDARSGRRSDGRYVVLLSDALDTVILEFV